MKNTKNVISIKPPPWRVLGYAGAGGSVIDSWVAVASDDALAKFDNRLRFLRSRLPTRWNDDHAHHLTGSCDGLFELKFEADNIAHRPLCCFGPSRSDFTVLLFATEHNDKLRPLDACKTALLRKAEIDTGTVTPKVY